MEILLNVNNKNLFILVDDWTGIIDCVLFKKTEIESDQENFHRKTKLESDLIQSLVPLRILQNGDLINIRGRINFYKDRPQIICNHIRIL